MGLQDWFCVSSYAGGRHCSLLCLYPERSGGTAAEIWTRALALKKTSLFAFPWPGGARVELGIKHALA
jgi:hypothetical protein